MFIHWQPFDYYICIMTLRDFKDSLLADTPPHLSIYLQALWYDAKSNWEKAHNLIQEVNDEKAAWIHAYLHRKEGDIGNADYWYRRARKSRPDISLNDEWENISNALL